MNFFLPKTELTVVLKYSVHYATAGKIEQLIERSFPNYKLYVLKCVYVEDRFVPVSGEDLCQVALSLASDFKCFNNVNMIRVCDEADEARTQYFFELGRAIEGAHNSADKVLVLCLKSELASVQKCCRCTENIKHVGVNPEQEEVAEGTELEEKSASTVAREEEEHLVSCDSKGHLNLTYK